MAFNKNNIMGIDNAYDKWLYQDYDKINESEGSEIKIIYDVEVQKNDYNDDVFYETLEECLDYIHECGYKKNEVKITKILFNENNLVLEVKEIITD